jgi:hypothetical protein
MIEDSNATTISWLIHNIFGVLKNIFWSNQILTFDFLFIRCEGETTIVLSSHSLNLFNEHCITLVYGHDLDRLILLIS